MRASRTPLFASLFPAGGHACEERESCVFRFWCVLLPVHVPPSRLSYKTSQPQPPSLACHSAKSPAQGTSGAARSADGFFSEEGLLADAVEMSGSRSGMGVWRAGLRSGRKEI